jgi:hypothetical protein
MYGVEALPKAWADAVELRDVIERLARDLYAVSVKGEGVDCEVYPGS